MTALPKSIAALPSAAPAWRDLLVAWAEINSGSDHPAGLARMASALRSEFALLPGATVDTVPLEGLTTTALRLRVRPEAPIQVLCSGHYDTVYGPENPFQHCSTPDADTLVGPGVADMKGGLVTMLAALHAFEQTAGHEALGWEIFLSPDEETGSVASSSLLAEAATRHHLALVFEPARANGDLVSSRKGIGTFLATCHGRAAHAGRDPAAGRNAILALAEFLPQADALSRELPGILLNVGTIRGGSAVNIVPDWAQAAINLRATQTSDGTEAVRRLHELAAPINTREGFRLEITGGFQRPPKEATPAEAPLLSAWQACGAALGLSFSWQHVGGGSDGNLLAAAGLPVLDGLGPVGDHLHSPQERIRLSSLAERAQVAALFLHRLAAGEIKLSPSFPSSSHE